jgi:hypothetical protein
LTVRISQPVSATTDLPSLGLHARAVLKLPRPLAYAARIYASLDGSEFVQVPGLLSGKEGDVRLDRLGAAAAQPGFHEVRVRAYLTFRDPGGPAWTEVRDLPQVFYALYDAKAASQTDARTFVYAPAAVPARQFDPLLGDEPFAVWLAGVLSTRRAAKEDRPHWSSQFCSERTDELGSRPDPTAICSVLHFDTAKRDIGQIWFRTADIRVTDGGVEWVKTSPPQFEELIIMRSTQSRQLSALPLLLDTDYAARPTGAVAIAPDDIVITPRTLKPGAPAAINVTVRNHGQSDLHKVFVSVVIGSTLTADDGQTREFVVDIASQASVEVALEAAFPQGFGFVQVRTMQISEHAPHDNWIRDPAFDDDCAFSVVNPGAAPPRYAESLRDKMGPCRGK